MTEPQIHKSFIKAFVPGLIVGLIVGAAGGAFLSDRFVSNSADLPDGPHQLHESQGAHSDDETASHNDAHTADHETGDEAGTPTSPEPESVDPDERSEPEAPSEEHP